MDPNSDPTDSENPGRPKVWRAGRWRRQLLRLGATVRRRLRPLRRGLARLHGAPTDASEIHIAWGGDPSRSITVFWAGRARDNPARVQIRHGDHGPWREVRGRSVARPGPSGHLHSAQIDGLEPDARHEYRVSCDPGFARAFSEIHSMRTAPQVRCARFEAVFLCDVGLLGRPDGTTRALPDVLAAILALDPLVVLGGGDYAYANRDSRHRDPGDAISAWFEQMQPLLARVPLMAQLGNHELELGESGEDWLLRLPPPARPGTRFSRSFDVAGAHFVGLHAPGRAPSALDLEWLADDLASAAARSADWRIVYQHAPIYAHGTAHPDRPELRSLAPLFARLNVDLHLSGHDQSYERTHALSADGAICPPEAVAGRDVYRSGRGVVYAKVSPAGKLSDRGHDFSRLRDETPAVVAVRHDRAHHWARIQIDDQAIRVLVEGLRGAGDAVSIIDDFSISRA